MKGFGAVGHHKLSVSSPFLSNLRAFDDKTRYHSIHKQISLHRWFWVDKMRINFLLDVNTVLFHWKVLSRDLEGVRPAKVGAGGSIIWLDRRPLPFFLHSTTMTDTFTFFPDLPSEIRHMIWRAAMTAQWSCNSFQNGKEVVYGKFPHRAASQACHEAYHVAHLFLTKTKHFGLFGFSRHILFVRDHFGATWSQDYSPYFNDFLSHVQHIVLNAKGYKRSLFGLLAILKYCTSLRTLVIIAPWFVPKATDQYDLEAGRAPSWDEWGAIYRNSPAELDLHPLINVFEHYATESDRSISQLLSNLRRSILCLPELPPDKLHLLYNLHHRTIDELAKVQHLLQKYGASSPRIYLKTPEEVSPRFKETTA